MKECIQSDILNYDDSERHAEEVPAFGATNESITAHKEEQGIISVEGKPLFAFSPVNQGSTQLIKAHREGTNAYRGP